MIGVGDRLELAVEQPAAGGRMIARHEGQVVLVSGAIPGERVFARVERVERRLAFAAVESVTEPSPDRRPGPADPACGGCSYAHIAYERQRLLKAAILADAFARLARMPLEAPVDVAASPETGYRMRARFHVRDGQAGFYREGTHQLCDAAVTGQLLPEAAAAVRHLTAQLTSDGIAAVSVDMADTMAGDARAIHVQAAGAAPAAAALAAHLGPALQTVSVAGADGRRAAAGPGCIGDPLDALTEGRASGRLERMAESFFQANRFVLPALVVAVMDAVLPAGEVLDLYAGVGLFSMALAGSGRDGILAVEGAGASGADLERNARTQAGRLTAVVAPVERYLPRRRVPPTVIVDPPRTGLSKEVLQALGAARPERLIYVSCDPATLARDSRGLADHRLSLRSLRAFDLFPNTPHIETLAVFERR